MEERLHELPAPLRIAHKERAKLPLRQQHDLTELLAAEAGQRLDVLRHLTDARDEQPLPVLLHGVELRLRARRALPILPLVRRTPEHAVRALAEGEDELHPRIDLRRRLACAQHGTRAQGAARLPVEREADGIEQRRLARARHAMDEEAAIRTEPLLEIDGFLADVWAERLQAESLDLHRASLSSLASASRQSARYASCAGVSGSLVISS